MSKENFSWIHFIGIGGTGMSGIAKVLLDLGYKVSGSDLNTSETTKRLIQNGAEVYLGHKAENLKSGVEVVVVSSAVPENNAEIIKAKQLGIPVIQRAEMLAKLMEKQKAICVAGAHGKTTTTSMIALVLEKNGIDPTVVVGGELNDIGGNAKLGRGEYLVAEADESDGSFLKLNPWATVITNIEDDHLDHYGTVENIIKAFGDFVKLGNSKGISVFCLDNPYIKQIIQHVPGKLITYGLEEEADYIARNISYEGLGSKADIYYKNTKLGEILLNVPGKHNISNALAAVAVGRELGVDFEKIVVALKGFIGVQRRFQIIGKVNNIQVVDDYAHHPTEIKATLEAARNCHNGRIIAIFQPHRYSRTKFLAKEFADSLLTADKILLDEIYAAGEKPIADVSTQTVKNYMRDEADVEYFKERDCLNDYLFSIVRSGDLVLTLGAGNVWQVGVNLVDRLLKEKAVKALV